MSGPGTCKQCGAQIIWAVTRYGMKRPYDVEPSGGPEGLTIIRYTAPNGSVGYSARNIRRDDPIDATRHRMHFDTCAKIHGKGSKKE